MTTRYVGFDSAWADHPRRPGAICALDSKGGFDAPRPAGFDAALAFLRERHAAGDLTLVGIDQPTIVPNESGARPADRVAASLMSWSGGGVQPAFRGKAAMFGDGAPIWRFLAALGFRDDPETAAQAATNTAAAGGFVMEVFPAMALLALDPAFTAARGAGPRYNPARPTFRQEAWRAVCRATSAEAARLGFARAAAWCDALDLDTRPPKPRQDALDAVLCALVAARSANRASNSPSSPTLAGPRSNNERIRIAETDLLGIGGPQCGIGISSSTRTPEARSSVSR